MKNLLGAKEAQAGVTLIELMIAIALIGVGILASVSAFSLVQKSITSSKARTLATNLAQEQMQIIMQQPYFDILVTTNPISNVSFTPTLNYDPGFFPPQTILQGSIWFTRYTYIQVVQEVNGVIQTEWPIPPDTGMRQITVSVTWKSPTGQQIVTVQNVINNPNTVMLDAVIQGKAINAATGGGVPLATIDIAENNGWRTNTDNSGNYSLHLSPGSFHLAASALGFYATDYFLSVASNGTLTQNITLTPISTGTVSGTAWLDNHLVISQVVASTGATNDIEYIELYNPTTSAILMGSNVSFSTPNIWPVVWDSSNNSSQRQLYYVSAGNSFIPSYGYYLISNTGLASDPVTSCSAFTVAGVTKAPDACWLHVVYPNHAIECNAAPCPINGNPWAAGSPDAGGISLYDSNGVAGGNRIDSVGWSDTAKGDPAPSSAVEGTSYTRPNGFQPADQFVRHTDTSSVTSANGRAYDSNNNSVDFLLNSPLTVVPYNSAAAPQTPTSGTPATGANVSVTDGVSSSAKALLTGSPPYAQFIVPGVATGTWSTFVDSSTASAEIDNVAVVYNTTTSLNAVILSTAGVVGIISGNITDILFNGPGFWTPPGVTVGIAGQTYPVNAITGHYSVRLPTGTYDVTANPNLSNAGYETQTIVGSSVTLGDETSNVNFQLAQGGKLSGFVTRDGVNPLPGVTVVALDSNGDAHDSEVSANNGSFLLINLTTGTYTIEPILDSSETSAPVSVSSGVVAGSTLAIGTFTVTGAMGVVAGSTTVSGLPIQTGVLIVISTSAITLPPPAISSNTLAGAAYYAGSSQENGTYSIQVRGSTTSYSVAGFYMHMNGQTPVISTQAISGVTVTAGQTTSGENFSW